MKKIITIFLLAVIIICYGCGKPEISKTTDTSVIVAFGDSLTYGTGAKKDQSYPAVLSDLTI